MVCAKPAGEQPKPELQVRYRKATHDSHGGVNLRRRDERPVIAQQRAFAGQVVWCAKAAIGAKRESIQRAGQVVMHADPPPPEQHLSRLPRCRVAPEPVMPATEAEESLAG